jgi:hypothetical protein
MRCDFKIDEHRERIKERIDDIALDMIDEIKNFEATYLKNLNEHFTLFDDRQSLESEMTEIEETFRNPNLSIQTIREMQDESLNKIQIKLNELNQVKKISEETNGFMPSLSLFNQNETCLFGSINLHYLNFQASIHLKIIY